MLFHYLLYWLNCPLQFSLPQTTLEMATVEKLLHQIPEDSVPCKIRAKRGCATHPRSIAERVRKVSFKYGAKILSTCWHVSIKHYRFVLPLKSIIEIFLFSLSGGHLCWNFSLDFVLLGISVHIFLVAKKEKVVFILYTLY